MAEASVRPTFGRLTEAKRAGEAASARAALPLVLAAVPGVRSMVQVGFGQGAWLAEAERLGVPEVRGVDGPWADLSNLVVDRDRITIADVDVELRLDRTFDLAVCVEYAEHLLAARAASFVAELARLAPVVAFSAAIPGQGGPGHVNEQWPAYWEERFAAVGFRLVDAVRRDLWRAPGGPGYLAQNLLLAVDERRLDSYPRLVEAVRADPGPVLPLVHPEVFGWKVRALRRQLGVRAAASELVEALRRRMRTRSR